MKSAECVSFADDSQPFKRFVSANGGNGRLFQIQNAFENGVAARKKRSCDCEAEFVFCRNSTPNFAGDLVVRRTRVMSWPFPENG